MATPKSGKTAPIILDEDQVAKLAGMGCTLAEIAAFFNCSVDTIGRNYAEALIRGREAGKASVRRMMWTHGRNGNSVALKYLVHNILKEKIEDAQVKNPDERSGSEIMEKLNSISTDMILRIVKDNEDKVC